MFMELFYVILSYMYTALLYVCDDVYIVLR